MGSLSLSLSLVKKDALSNNSGNTTPTNTNALAINTNINNKRPTYQMNQSPNSAKKMITDLDLTNSQLNVAQVSPIPPSTPTSMGVPRRKCPHSKNNFQNRKSVQIAQQAEEKSSFSVLYCISTLVPLCSFFFDRYLPSLHRVYTSLVLDPFLPCDVFFLPSLLFNFPRGNGLRPSSFTSATKRWAHKDKKRAC